MLDVLPCRVRRGGGEEGKEEGPGPSDSFSQSGRTLQAVPSLARGRPESPRTRPDFSAACALGHVSLRLLDLRPMRKYRLIPEGRDGSKFSLRGVSTFS